MRVKTSVLMLSLGLLSTTAMAADLPSRTLVPIAPLPPSFTWTGLYFGAQVGYEFGRSTVALFSPVTGAELGVGTANPSGVAGGVHIGYIYEVKQLSIFGGLKAGGIIGVEGSVDGTSSKSDIVVANVNHFSNEPIQGSFRGRIGLSFDRTLVYGTGGIAFDYLRSNDSIIRTLADNQTNVGSVGVTFGGGVEHSITDTLSARVEYRYTTFGSIGEFPTPTPAFNTRVHESDNRVEFGLSYRIGPPTPTPVVARY